MHKNKLFLLFKSLSTSELRALRQFVRSPFHNQREDVGLLFNALEKANLEKLKEELLFRKVYPKEAFDKKKLAYVMNYLLKVIEDFFAISELQKNESQRQFWIAKAALAHGQENIFHQKIKKAKGILEKETLNNLKTEELKYEMEMELYHLKKNQIRGVDLGLKKSSQHLDIFLIGTKLRQACLLLAHQNTSKMNYQYDLLNAILDYIETPENLHLLDFPAISLYYFSYKTLAKEKATYFEKLKVLLFKYQDCFTKVELKDFYSIGLNFCIKQINNGKSEYIKVLYEWYRKALQEEVLLEHGVLSQVHYKHITALGLDMKEYDWVKKFILEYKSKIELQNRDSNFNYNMAKWHFEKGDFGTAMQLLQVVKYDDILPHLTSKILWMKIYYELGEFDVLSSYLKSFESAVRRQRKIGYQKTNYLNVISIMRKILNVNPFDKNSIKEIELKIEKEKILPEKKWFLAKVKKLGK